MNCPTLRWRRLLIAHSLTHYLIRLLIRAFTHSLILLLTHKLTTLFNCSLTLYPLTYSPSPTHSLILPLTHPPTHSSTLLPIHLLTITTHAKILGLENLLAPNGPLTPQLTILLTYSLPSLITHSTFYPLTYSPSLSRRFWGWRICWHPTVEHPPFSMAD